MTTTQDAALTPLWSNDRLRTVAFAHATFDRDLFEAALIAAHAMRDEYESELANLRAKLQVRDEQIGYLRDMVVAQNSELIEAQKYILEIKRAVSGDWQPVTPGFEIECAGKSGWRLYASEGDIGVVNSRDRTKEYYVYAEPHGLRLCKWQPTPTEAQA